MKRYDDKLDFDGWSGKGTDRRLIAPIIVVVILLLAIIVALVCLNREDGSDEQGNASVTEDAELEEGSEVIETMGEVTEDMEGMGDTEDPQNGTAGSMSQETGVSVDVQEQLLASDVAETEGTTVGIDVAKYQGTIDWEQVAASGIDFVMVRVGYRTQKTGEICADTNAKYNMQEAQANGIKVGVYFFSTAVNEEEAKEEADWVADYIAQYQITYPVAYNCEGFDDPESRQYSLSQTERTDVAIAFMNAVYEHGYTPMFYAAKNELEDDAKWDTSRIAQSFKIWMAWYPDYIDGLDEGAEFYAEGYDMWQYTSQGTVAGIKGTVDVNVAYFAYEGTADAKSDETPETVTADAEALMNFTEVNETVTAKEKTNLRDIPSQDSDSTVMATLSNGETATRTGISDSGWSRLEYNGSVYYAVSNYLKTALSYQASYTAEGSGSGDGLKTKFTEVNDVVTAKIEVNLRALPSVTNPDAVVVAVLYNGETVTRTGINEDYGWSRVEYNGQTLYCISSYLTTVAQ